MKALQEKEEITTEEREIWLATIRKHDNKSQLALRRFKDTGHCYFQREYDFHRRVAEIAREVI